MKPSHTQFSVAGKRVDLFIGEQPGCPVIYLNTFADQGGQIWRELEGMGTPPCSLAAISSLDWDHDMAPWDIPPISPDDTPCTGGADDYLRVLTREIVPRVEELLQERPAWRGLAGYSLAGLFALYAMYHTDMFSRIASMSGSLWFPGFLEYATGHECERKPDRLYLSLGDKESAAANPYLKTVRENTDSLAAYYRGIGIQTKYRLNSGNHYAQALRRTAFGIQWLLLDTPASLFSRVAVAHRDEPAIIETGKTLTFGGLSRLAARIAASFPAGTETVGIIMNHGARMIAAMLAALMRGVRYVPAEPSFPIGRIRYMMGEARADFVLTEREYADRLAGLPLRFIEEAVRERTDDEDFLAPVAQDPDAPAYVLYTSGTTGRPKGVCVANRNICHYVRAFEREFHAGPGDIMLQYSVCSFDIFVEEVYASLLNGAALAIPGPEEKKDLASLMAFVSRMGVTIISGFPYLLADMNNLPRIPACLRLLISGGDVLRASYVDRLLGQAEVYNTYGPSETTVCATYYHCNGGQILEDGTYPIGKPVLGASIQILEPEAGTGEICIRGGGVSLGYIGDHEEENKAFVPLQDGSVMYRSGDLGYFLPDGNLAFLHRKDTQIMIYGKRVEVMEVEARLCQCDGVSQALVRSYQDEKGLSYMVAYIVTRGPDIKLSDIRLQLSENLTSFMIPEFFVKMTRIPLNANGKPDPAKLPIVLKEG